MLVDCMDRAKSYYLTAERLQQELRKWEEDETSPTFLAHDRYHIGARDYIIGLEDDDLIELNYAGISGLYVEEFINLKSGIYPDTRKLGRIQ